MKSVIRQLSVILALLGLPSCTTLGLDYFRPKIALPQDYGNVALSPIKAIPSQWWTLYKDPTLNMLVDKAYENNTNIKTAVARIEEADAQLRETGAYLLPSVDVGANSQRSKVTAAGAFPVFGPNPRNSFDISLRSSIELDFWGKLSRAKESARAQYLSTLYAKETVALSIQSLVVNSYLQIRSLDSQIQDIASNLTVAEASLALAKQREAGGVVSMLDVHQAEVVKNDLQMQMQDFQRQRRLAEHVLIILTLEEVKVATADLMQLPMPPMP
ncbi:MAG: TolC family protein, partial [Methylophilaceae bacterium]|nr:TolC family protein [Methylophilaceae bacterium]